MAGMQCSRIANTCRCDLSEYHGLPGEMATRRCRWLGPDMGKVSSSRMADRAHGTSGGGFVSDEVVARARGRVTAPGHGPRPGLFRRVVILPSARFHHRHRLPPTRLLRSGCVRHQTLRVSASAAERGHHNDEVFPTSHGFAERRGRIRRVPLEGGWRSSLDLAPRYEFIKRASRPSLAVGGLDALPAVQSIANFLVGASVAYSATRVRSNAPGVRSIRTAVSSTVRGCPSRDDLKPRPRDLLRCRCRLVDGSTHDRSAVELFAYAVWECFPCIRH